MRHLSILLLTLFSLNYASTRLITHESDAPFIYYYSQADNAFVIERADGADRHRIGKGLLTIEDWVYHLHWSPGGKWLLWNQYHNDQEYEFALRYDGSMLREGAVEKEVRSTLEGDDPPPVVPPRETTYLHPERRTLILENVETGSSIEFMPPLHPLASIDWSPNRQHALVYTGLDQAKVTEDADCCQIWLMSIDDPTLRLLTTTSPPMFNSYWSTDSTWADYRATVEVWERVYVAPFRIEPRDGPEPDKPYPDPFRANDYRVSPDGRYAASIRPCDDTWAEAKCIINLATGQILAFPIHQFFYGKDLYIDQGRASWHPDSEWVLFVEYYDGSPDSVVSVGSVDGFYRDVPPCFSGTCPQWLPPNVPIED